MPPTRAALADYYRAQRGVLLLALVALLGAFAFGAMVRVARADNTHVTCVLHGFVSGASDTDGSFFSRVSPGCSSTYRQCSIYSYGVLRGYQSVYDTTSTCSSWSRDFGNYTECAGAAGASNPGVFSDHAHGAPYPC
jgi:hypothetical protein